MKNLHGVHRVKIKTDAYSAWILSLAPVIPVFPVEIPTSSVELLRLRHVRETELHAEVGRVLEIRDVLCDREAPQNIVGS